MMGFALVAAGGALGSMARYGAGLAAARWLGTGWPWGTLAVNLSGGLLIGLLAGWLAGRGAAGENARLLLGVGFLGGFTTFSAFSLETMRLIEARLIGQALLYAGGSVVLGVLAVFVGYLLMRRPA